MFLEAPFGIGIKQGNTALKSWVDSRLEPDAQEGPVPPDPEGERSGAVLGLVLEEHPASEATRSTYAPATRAERGARSARSEDRGRRPHGGRPPLLMLVAFDFWAFVSDELGRAAPRASSEHAQGLRDRDRRRLRRSALVLGAARAHRIPVVSQLAAVYVEVIRNTPILVQIFLLFYGAAAARDPRSTPFTVAWLSVMIWGGAFNTENFRAGLRRRAAPLPRGGATRSASARSRRS